MEVVQYLHSIPAEIADLIVGDNIGILSETVPHNAQSIPVGFLLKPQFTCIDPIKAKKLSLKYDCYFSATRVWLHRNPLSFRYIVDTSDSDY